MKPGGWTLCLSMGWASVAAAGQVFVEDGKTERIVEAELLPMSSRTDRMVENLERLCPWNLQFPFKEGAREALENPAAYEWENIGRVGDSTISLGRNRQAAFLALVSEDKDGCATLLYVCFDDGRGIYEETTSIQGDLLWHRHYYDGTGRWWFSIIWHLNGEGRLDFGGARTGSDRYGDGGP